MIVFLYPGIDCLYLLTLRYVRKAYLLLYCNCGLCTEQSRYSCLVLLFFLFSRRITTKSKQRDSSTTWTSYAGGSRTPKSSWPEKSRLVSEQNTIFLECQNQKYFLCSFGIRQSRMWKRYVRNCLPRKFELISLIAKWIEVIDFRSKFRTISEIRNVSECLNATRCLLMSLALPWPTV